MATESATTTGKKRPVQPPRSRWRKRLGCGCLSALVSLALGVVVLEWILRAQVGHFLGAPGEAMFMYEMDGERSYRLRPGWRGEQTIDGRTTSIRINSRGMRGGEIGAKAPGETRIAIFGDSYVFGHGVAEAESIPSQVEQVMRGQTNSASITVANCGISGQGLRDMVNSVERQLDLEPDLFVLVSYLGNDFTDDCREYTAIAEGFLLFGGMARAAFESTRFRLTLRYRTAYLLEQALTRFAPAWAFDRSRLGPTPAEQEALEHFPPDGQRFACLFFDRRANDALVGKILARTRQSLTAIQARTRGKPLLLVLLPSKWHVDEAMWRDLLEKQGADPSAHEFGLARRRMVDLAGSIKIPVLDLAPSLRDVPEPRSMWLQKDHHLSARGCRVAAAEIAAAAARILGR